MLDHENCYRALRTRDIRFDGRIFVAVRTTKIYCRPVCPAPTAKSKNCTFYPSAAAAQTAGYRPCLRCRPETVADLGAWRGTSNTVSRGLALIAEGGVDGEKGVEELADRLGVSGRHLRRLFQEHVGASPVAVAQTRRVLFAKQLIHETQLSMAEVAFAAGFGSVRRFNEIFLTLFKRPPSALRRSLRSPATAGATGIGVRIRYRAPYDWSAILGYFKTRAIPGVERVENDTYARTFQVNGDIGTLIVRHDSTKSSLWANIEIARVATLSTVVNRLRNMFDVAADVGAIETQLLEDPLLATIVGRQSGLRVPSTWNGFELAIRAILGQQVNVEAGRVLTEKLVQLCGTPLANCGHKLTHLFPDAVQVAAADLSSLGMPAARKRALVAVSHASLHNPQLFGAGCTLEETVACLQQIKGVGPWTANYIALRACREPDAFPAGDAVLLRVVAHREGKGLLPQDLGKRAEAWRPWRGYAAQHLWNSVSVQTEKSGER